jgi:hypothetical protein
MDRAEEIACQESCFGVNEQYAGRVEKIAR